jgi:hypothetical protein
LIKENKLVKDVKSIKAVMISMKKFNFVAEISFN